MKNIQNIVQRCGKCSFAEGGDKVSFQSGDTNYRYNCTCLSRNKNIVLLDTLNEKIVWENQKACEKFNSTGSTLKKRIDLNKLSNISIHDGCSGYFEIVE